MMIRPFLFKFFGSFIQVFTTIRIEYAFIVSPTIRILVFCLLVQTFISYQSMANDIIAPVSIAAGEMPYLLSANAERAGAYDQLMTQISKQLDSEFELFYLPPARAGLTFENNVYDCLMPGQMANMVDKDKRIASKPFHYAKAYIFNSISQPPITSIDMLNGKVLATRRGFIYGGLKFSQKVEVIEVNNIRQSIEMLNKNRIDAFIAYEPDILGVLNSTSGQNVHRAALVLHQQPEKIVCHVNARTVEFINGFDLLIDQYMQSGKLDNIIKSNSSHPMKLP